MPGGTTTTTLLRGREDRPAPASRPDGDVERLAHVEAGRPLSVTRAPSTARAGLAVAMLRQTDLTLRLVELDVPVQVVAPALGRVAHCRS